VLDGFASGHCTFDHSFGADANAFTQPADRNELCLIGQKEIRLETELQSIKPVLETQLINSQRKLEALGHLSQSLVRESMMADLAHAEQRWFIDSLLDLQRDASDPLSPGGATADSHVRTCTIDTRNS